MPNVVSDASLDPGSGRISSHGACLGGRRVARLLLGRRLAPPPTPSLAGCGALGWPQDQQHLSSERLLGL